MKTKSRQGRRRFQLRILAWGNSYYIERIAKLEAALVRKPRWLQLDMVGVGEIPADAALQIRSVLMNRSPKTRIITNACSSLQGGSVLIWLLGDERMIREDARLYFRRADFPEDAEAKPDEPWKEAEPKFRDSFSEIDPEEADYATVLQGIDEFLPVKELAGRLIGVQVLRQFGLVDNERVDQFLATAFAKKRKPARASSATAEKRIRGRARSLRSRQVRR